MIVETVLGEQIENRTLKKEDWKRLFNLERRIARDSRIASAYSSVDWRDATLAVIRERQRQDPLRYTFFGRLRDVAKLHADRKLHEAVRYQIATLASYLSNETYMALMELERTTMKMSERKLLILGGNESDHSHEMRKWRTKSKYAAGMQFMRTVLS